MNLDRIIAVRNNKTVYQDGSRCLKVFGRGYSQADVLNEALNQTRIRQTGLPVPRVLEVTTIEGKWTIVSEFIRGKSLAQLIHEHPGDKSAYLDQLVVLQLQMHARACPELKSLREKLHARLDQCDLPATTRYDLHVRLDAMPEHHKVCHGDFNPSNVIIASDGSPYLLDWAHAAQGNASADTARTYLLFWLDGDIDGAEQYLRRFCRASGTDPAYVQRWMPIVAAAQTVRCHAAEREFLHSWINSHP